MEKKKISELLDLHPDIFPALPRQKVKDLIGKWCKDGRFHSAEKNGRFWVLDEDEFQREIARTHSDNGENTNDNGGEKKFGTIEKQILFYTIVGCVLFFSIISSNQSVFSFFFLMLGLVFGSPIVGCLVWFSFRDRRRKKVKRFSAAVAFSAAVGFALVCIVIAKSDVHSDLKGKSSTSSGPTAEEKYRKKLRGAAEKLFDNCQRYGKSYDPRC